ncbi:MAG: hypothetical protein N5P05_001686 [Chroococcopsis gigantea SAG 12.99]|jgi:hypothetical protein|nr:COP23 domain-containing protein [Chlorogloea purpurea SAG 13.99]MDV3000080.1 hypothetical protein [Chroococcopsis gigantea SAG 12.99]
MNKTVFGLSILLASLGLSVSAPGSVQAQNVTFTCSVDSNNIPTTYAQTPDGNTPVFKWTSKYFKPPYTPMQRCQEVSQRMNGFYAQGQLDYITSGRINKLPVICAGSGCNSNGKNVLITLKPEQDPAQVLQEIEANRSGAAGPSYQFGGGSTSSTSRTSSLNTNSDGTVSLDMNQLLGTGREGNGNNTNNVPGMIPGSNNTSGPPSSNRRAW